MGGPPGGKREQVQEAPQAGGGVCPRGTGRRVFRPGRRPLPVLLVFLQSEKPP